MKSKKENRKSAGEQWQSMKNCAFMVGQVAKYSPSFFVLTMLEGIISGVTGALVNTVLIKVLFDRLELGVSFASVALVIIVTAAVHFTGNAYSFFYGWAIKQWLRQKLQRGMHKDLFAKARSLDLSCYDDPVFYNDFVWAINQADSRASNIVDDIRITMTNLIFSFASLILLLTIDPVMVIVSLVFSFISSRISLLTNKLSKKREEAIMPHTRRSDYVARALTLPEYAKETRIGHAPDLLLAKYRESIDGRKKVTVRFGKKLCVLGSAYEFSRTCSSVILHVYMAWKLFSGAITLGGFAAANNAVWNLYWGFQEIAENYTKFVNHGLFAEKYRTFLAYEPKITSGEKPVPVIDTLTFDKVRFRYPGAQSDSLDEISFSIRRGEKVAIVGYNGAGKTTLIKLLLRLYDPTEGSIRVNGEDIRELELQPYREKYGTVFQDFQIFASTIAENVIADIYTDDLRQKVEQALEKSTFSDKLATLENGIDTPLTREFDDKGVNLSGGESQKIAIARVFAHDGEIIVMDEPSSALDPISEYQLNETILCHAQDKTVIFISHRLSTTRMADRILMFANGRLIEDGSHEELMKLNGKYAEMFRMQAEKYTA